jgi:hypothetical protein
MKEQDNSDLKQTFILFLQEYVRDEVKNDGKEGNVIKPYPVKKYKKETKLFLKWYRNDAQNRTEREGITSIVDRYLSTIEVKS